MIDYEKVRAWRSGDVRHDYTTKDTILYALGVGAGADPLDKRQLRFIYEKNLTALPTMAAVLASPGFWMREKSELGIDYLKLVHGEQAVDLHAPLPAEGAVIGTSRVVRLVDKGADKGAVMHVEKQLLTADDRQPIATVEQVLFLRGNGGFSEHGGGDEPAPPAPATPETEPELTLSLPTRRDQAALYRLNGDFNPLHIDPDVAGKAGFPGPILHGLATYGIACRGLIETCCDGDAMALRSIRARLSAPVYPGETIELHCWRSGGEIRFLGRVPERDIKVLSNGMATLETRT